jgi:hypothetical protein
MQLLLRAGRAIGQSLGQMLSQVTNTEARERLAATVLKQIGVSQIFVAGSKTPYELRWRSLWERKWT